MKRASNFERNTSLFSGFIHCLYFIYARNQRAQNLTLVSLRSQTTIESSQRSFGNLSIQLYTFYSIAEHFFLHSAIVAIIWKSFVRLTH